MIKLISLGIMLLMAWAMSGCATSTAGLTKDQIADRERARNARISFYSQVVSGIAVGAATGLVNAQGYRK